MNKSLFVKVKDLCKDTGLSEKYLKAITEKMGGSIEDDSTDETAIENLANQIAGIAVETQGEATRWANKKDSKETKDDKETKESKETKETKETEDPNAAKIAALEKELNDMKANQGKAARDASVSAAVKKHNIPEWRMKGVVVPDDQDPDVYLAAIKQDLITQNLMPADAEGQKEVTKQAANEAASSLLDSITVK